MVYAEFVLMWGMMKRRLYNIIHPTVKLKAEGKSLDYLHYIAPEGKIYNKVHFAMLI